MADFIGSLIVAGTMFAILAFTLRHFLMFGGV